ncbi:tRNA (adenosine(37)-N6)-threonylcarbamoyltransferase complex ATPase subunit type 1 TsaE [Singulisphaera sp. PoT]|uniref:tRNA (adenosine(37)-N6)-threonylcarbamoyltransferase complex ATPase subunit type 1 TsaE n=1 Tax=Singulisphaera sp. PoT TaxID=3411797 RepID=UPI003BF4D9B2
MRLEYAPGKLTVEVESPQETDLVGQALAQVVEAGVVLGLVGTLGAGKTRLVRGLAEALGVDPRAIASPTFVLIHEYEGRLPIYHFDTYRLNGGDEFDALGAADYFAGDGICLIEWADLVSDRLPLDSWFLHFESTGPEGRLITATIPEPRARALFEWLNSRKSEAH